MIFSSDIVIAGGGIAGVSAAIAAAQENKRVLLIDKLNEIGGASVNANVGTVCGAFYRSFNAQNIAGNSFSNFFLQKLDQTEGISKPYVYQDGLYIIPYEWSALRNMYQQLLNEFNVEVRLSTSIEKVKVHENRITEIITQNSDIIQADSIIDCGGNAVISQLAGLDTLKDESYQAASQIFRIKNISETNEYSLNMALKKAVLKFENEMSWPKSHRSLSVVQGSIRNNCVDLKLSIQEVISDQTNIPTLNKSASIQIEEIFKIIQPEIKSFEHAIIETVFPLAGYRVLQRSKGKYILTEEDVLTCKKSATGVAVGTWPIEEWDYEGKVHMQFFEEDNGYHLPAECLISDQLENLFFAGRNISATSKAIASARVMGTCWQTGYAAGKLSCAQNDLEHKQVIAKLNRELH